MPETPPHAQGCHDFGSVRDLRWQNLAVKTSTAGRVPTATDHRPGPFDIRRVMLASVLVYLAMRVISIALLTVAGHYQVAYAPWTEAHPDYFGMAGLWDGVWYRQIAESGYPATLPVNPDGTTSQSAWAFFPLVAVVSGTLSRLTGLDFAVVGSVISLAAGAAASALMARLLFPRLSAGATVAAIAVWAASPASPVLGVPYTESAALLLICGFLLAFRNDRWLVASLCAMALGFTRPLGVPLMVVVAGVALVRWRQARSHRVLIGPGILVAVLAASVVVWPTIVGLALNEPGALTRARSGWAEYGSALPLEPWLRWFVHWDQWYAAGPALWVGMLVGVGGLVIAVRGWSSSTLDLDLRIWTVAYLGFMVVVGQPYMGYLRYALLGFPLFVLILGAGKDSPGRSWGVRTVVVVGIELMLQVLWIFGVWVFTPPSGFAP